MRRYRTPQRHWSANACCQLMALTTEHFTLQTARSATIADNNGRSALYLTTVSSAVVALAFIGQLTPPETPMVLSGGANASVVCVAASLRYENRTTIRELRMCVKRMFAFLLAAVLRTLTPAGEASFADAE